MIPQVDSCCGSVSLKTGCKAIGWGTLILNIIITIMLAIGVAGLFALSSSKDLTPDQQNAAKHIAVIACVILVIQIICTLLPIILLLGVYQQNGCYLLTWVWITLVVNVVSLISIIASFDPRQGYFWMRLFLTLLYFYFIVVVNSFYKETFNLSSSA